VRRILDRPGEKKKKVETPFTIGGLTSVQFRGGSTEAGKRDRHGRKQSRHRHQKITHYGAGLFKTIGGAQWGGKRQTKRSPRPRAESGDYRDLPGVLKFELKKH